MFHVTLYVSYYSAHLHYCLFIFTCMCDSEQVTVWGLRSVNHRDLYNGFEDRTINCPTKVREFQRDRGGKKSFIIIYYWQIWWKNVWCWTNPDIPGNVSSSCNNGALRHCCHTTNTLPISTQIIHLKQQPTLELFQHHRFVRFLAYLKLWEKLDIVNIIPAGHLSLSVCRVCFGSCRQQSALWGLQRTRTTKVNFI